MKIKDVLGRGERMKRIAIIVAVLGICVGSWGQDKPATQNPPAGQAAGQAAGQPAAPQGKRPPKVNNQEEGGERFCCEVSRKRGAYARLQGGYGAL